MKGCEKMELRNQVVVVTGASRGLGAAIARAFVREGAKVVINYFNSEDKAKSLEAELGENAIALQADVRDTDQVKAMFARAKEHFGQAVTTVVNNALVDFKFDAEGRKTVDTIEWEDYRTQFEGSVQASLNTTKVALADMKEQSFGRIITIGTNLVQHPVVAYHEYTTGKAALLGFTRNMAKERGAFGITVNMVSGGLLHKTDASAATSDFVFDLIRQSTPIQRVVTPEEMADAVLMFASPLSRAVTGQNLVVDGGLVMD